MIPVLGVPTLTRHDLCERLLESIDYPVEHLVIVNNGDPAWRAVKPKLVERLSQIDMPANQGVAGSWNLIIKATPFAPYWLITGDDTWFPEGSLEEIACKAGPDALYHLQVAPKWASFAIGEDVVRKAGLACELFHPAYFEDNDWQRRIDEAAETKYLDIPVHHDNSSTLKSGFEYKNGSTFVANMAVYERRREDGVSTGGEWDLDIRRANSWD